MGDADLISRIYGPVFLHAPEKGVLEVAGGAGAMAAVGVWGLEVDEAEGAAEEVEGRFGGRGFGREGGGSGGGHCHSGRGWWRAWRDGTLVVADVGRCRGWRMEGGV